MSNNVLLCRSDEYLGKELAMFSFNGVLMAISKQKLKDVKNLFFVNRENYFIKNGLSSPVVVQIQVTNRCNLSCRHCYVSSGKANSEEMSDQEITKLLLDLRSWGVLKIQWVGGEVFTRKGFLNLAQYAKELGFEQSLLTNGVFFGLKNKDKSIFHHCWDLFYTIQVSVDDFGDNFNQFVGRKNVWAIVFDAIDNLSQSKPKNKTLSIATIIRPDNILAIPKIVRLFDGKIDLVRLGKEIPTGRSLNTQKLTIEALFNSWEEVLSLRKSDVSVRIGHPFDKNVLQKSTLLPSDWKSDNGARTFMYIGSDGTAYPFPLLVNIKGFCGGSVLKDDLDSIWLSKAFKSYREIERKDTGCKNCKKECQIWPRYHFIYNHSVNLREKPFSHPGCDL
ncbi:MAG: radical SAM protein [Candidatus Pacebacteria bacterium]|nr:radical SAM protein [Candidatus Paceibacterota bacterium]